MITQIYIIVKTCVLMDFTNKHVKKYTVNKAEWLEPVRCTITEQPSTHVHVNNYL